MARDGLAAALLALSIILCAYTSYVAAVAVPACTGDGSIDWGLCPPDRVYYYCQKSATPGGVSLNHLPLAAPHRPHAPPHNLKLSSPV